MRFIPIMQGWNHSIENYISVFDVIFTKILQVSCWFIKINEWGHTNPNIWNKEIQVDFAYIHEHDKWRYSKISWEYTKINEKLYLK